MKRLKRRLFFHFSFQFISLAIAIIILVFFLLLILVMGITKKESEFNYYQAKIETISMDTENSIKELRMANGWDQDFAEEQIWVQIVNHHGEVIEASNVPEDIPTQYSQHDLYQMQKTNEFSGYSLYFYLETLYEEPYLFILGHEDEAQLLLRKIVDQYGKQGFIPDEELHLVEDKLLAVNGTVRIFDKKEQIVQELGYPLEIEEELPLDIFVRHEAPDIYSTQTTVVKEEQTESLWILYTPNMNGKEFKLGSLKDITIAFAVSGIVVLLITIVISFWNGFRYGNPLFIFTSWLSRMGSGNYSEVLTEREKKLIFRKNGKVRLRYRLYSEVFQAFYQMAEQLSASTKEREELERTREEWMAGISHDLRTPLTTMQGYGTLLESGQYDWSKQELEDIGKTISEKSTYMLSLIEDFSLSFRLKNDAALAKFQTVEVNQLITNLVYKFQEDLTLVDYHLSYQPLKEDLFLNIDPHLFERMMDNLIYNAIIHNPPGTSIDIIIEETSNSRIKIMIKDNGIGMDEETKKHLFNRYYRGTNTEERPEGSGLGMSIAMHIAKLHGGQISIESQINHGTTVTVETWGRF